MNIFFFFQKKKKFLLNNKSSSLVIAFLLLSSFEQLTYINRLEVSFLNEVSRSKRLEKKVREGNLSAIVLNNWLLTFQFYNPIGRRKKFFYNPIGSYSRLYD